MTIDFLRLADALAIHQDQISRYGGGDGVRDEGLLESAISRPCATFSGQFVHDDVYAMAAAYLFHIVSNHPFIDGNIRCGALAALTFLAINDVELDLKAGELYTITIAVAKGESGKDAIASFFRERVITSRGAEPAEL